MTHQEAKQYIQNFYIKSNNDELERHTAVIEDFCQFIQENENPQQNPLYIFYILMDTGYIFFKGFDLPDSIQTMIKKTFTMLDNKPQKMDFTLLFNIIDLNVYNTSFQSFQSKTVPDIRSSLSQEQDWEEHFWVFEDLALDIVINALDIQAINKGYDIIGSELTNIQNFNPIWQQYQSLSSSYLTKFNNIREKLYAHKIVIADFMERFPYIHDCTFKKIIQDITKHRETHASEQNYRRVIASEIAEDFYSQIQNQFPDHTPASWVMLYKHVLAEEALKTFICNTLAGLNKNFNDLKIESTINTVFDHKQPAIRINNTEYSVYILENRQLDGWGIRKDHFNQFFSASENYQGALCFSLRVYPNENVLVRFDNYIPKKEFAAYINEKKELFEGYVKVPFSDIYKEDLREHFFEQIKNMVVISYTIVLKDILAKTEEPVSENKIYHQAIPCMALLAHYFLAAKSWKKLGSKKSDPPTYTVLYVPENFKDKKDYDFLNPVNATDNFNQLKKYMKKQWGYFLLFINNDQQIKMASEKSHPVKKGIKAGIPPETCIAILCVGPEKLIDEMITALDSDSPKELTPNLKEKIFWVIYGPDK
jgi:hypothetical protein